MGPAEWYCSFLFNPGTQGGRGGKEAPGAGCDFREMASGRIGKLLVFKSGKVKMLVGDVLMDVSMGLPNQHRQDVVAVNPTSAACVLLGNVHERVLVSPDVLQLMARDQVPEFRRAPELLPELTAEHRRVRGYNVDGEGGEAGGSGGAGADGAAAGVAGVRIKSEVP
eukprot:XP_001702362.1 predicted protein [Chlamydomonas reinhardtii]